MFFYDFCDNKKNYTFFSDAYFGSSAKLDIHVVDCEKLNDRAIRLPNEDK